MLASTTYIVYVYCSPQCSKWKFQVWKLRGCLVCDFKQLFSIFKQHFTHFNTLFHPHVFPQMFLNNNFQFLNTQTKRALNNWKMFHKCKYVLMNELVLFSTFILNYKRIINELNLFEKFFDSRNVSMHCLLYIWLYTM